MSAKQLGLSWIWDALLKLALVAVPLAASLMVWIVAQVYDHESRLLVIAETRFTRTDGMELEARQRRELQAAVDETTRVLRRLELQVSRIASNKERSDGND